MDGRPPQPATLNESAELETIVDAPNASARSAVATKFEAGTAATLISTEALAIEELARTRAFAAVLAALVGVAFFFVPFQPVPTWLNAIMAVCLAGVAILCTWVWYRSRHPQSDQVKVMRVFAGGCGAASLIIVYYGGVFSPAPVALVLGLSFFALSDDRRFVSGVIISVVVGYVLLALGVAVGFVPQHSLIIPTDIGGAAKAFAVVVTGVCLAITVWHARLARKATRKAIERLSLAITEVRRGEALVNEAHQQLDVALNLDAGQRGRFSGEVAGLFVVGDLIGRGAMGEIYAATSGASDARAAVKIVAERIGGRVASVERFHREARLVSKLRCDNIVSIYSVGETNNGNPYIAMELLDGADLGWILRRSRQMPMADAVSMVQQVARGLDAAHEAGVIHRDIKPENLFRDSRRAPPVWKILDFGVARESNSGGTLTQGGLIGTPGYMAPEQARAEKTGRRSDVFALGAVAYRCMTGQPPFVAESAPATMYQVVHYQPARPSQLMGFVGSHGNALDAVFAVVLAKKPGERFATASEFASMLADAAQGRLSTELRHRAGHILRNAPWGEYQTGGD